MRFKLTPVFASLLLVGLINSPVYSAASSVEQKIDRLESEISSLKQQLGNNNSSSVKSVSPRMKSAGRAPSIEHDESKTTSADILPGPHVLPQEGAAYFPIDVDVPGQSFVSTGPYIGVPLEFAGTNLIINSPNINEDVSLLKIRKNIFQRFKALGVPIEEQHAHLLLSGIIEAQMFYQKPFSGANRNEIDLSTAELDGYILGPSNWISGLLSFAYDNSLANFTNARTFNSRVFVNKAFIVIGDFTRSPLYASFGQMYVPFGTYSSNMVSSPLTKILGRIKTRALVVGAQPQVDNAPYIAMYIFRGDSHLTHMSSVNNGGVNLGYHFKYGIFSGNFGGGFVGNLADSQGMQLTGNLPLFNGFGGPVPFGSERLARRVTAINLRGLFSFGTHVDLLLEYIAALHSFSPFDMTVNTHPAIPSAANGELAYTYTILDGKPSSVAIGYALTHDALAIGIPAKRYSLVFNTSFWRDTLQSLEFRRDIDYSLSNTSTGSSVPGPSGTGRGSNAVTLQFDLYF